MRSLKVALLAVVSMFALVACDTNATTTIEACVSRSNGDVRIVAPGQRCWVGEYRTSWAQEGDKGDKGDPGAPGEKGAPGAQGPEGLSVRSGDGAPAAELGRVGEFYVDFSASELYGPKTDAGWGDPVELIGPAGADGEKGDTGDQGPQGPAGEAGADGAAGADGIDGVDGNRLHLGVGIPSGDAADGDMYLDEVSFTLWGRDAGAWVEVGSLRGPQGPIGPQGPVGEQGEKGDQGDQGLQGIPGIQGLQGIAGLNGADGADGNRISRGTGVPTAAAADGDLYLDEATFELYSRTGGAWVSLGSLRGEKGDTGDQGIQGPMGPMGPQGPSGVPAPDSRFGQNRPNISGYSRSAYECTMGQIWLTGNAMHGTGTPLEGQFLSIAQNNALYALIGTRFGGDGVSTFRLPDLRDAAPNGLAYVMCTQGYFPSMD